MNHDDENPELPFVISAMVNSFVRVTLEKQLETVTTRLEHSLRNLKHRTETSIEALRDGRQLDTLMMKNSVDIDSLSSDYNRIKEILAMLSTDVK